MAKEEFNRYMSDIMFGALLYMSHRQENGSGSIWTALK
jgi:hypothetical protein